MARKITIFELHLDGARVGPTFSGNGESADAASETRTGDHETATGVDAMDEMPADEEMPDGASTSRARSALAVLAAVAVTSLVGRSMLRRRRGGRHLEQGDAVEMADDETGADETSDDEMREGAMAEGGTDKATADAR